MVDNRTLPFRERAYKNYRDEMADLKEVEALLQEKEPSDIEMFREPLSIGKRKEVTILLSWGGPSEGYKVYYDQEGEVMEGYYFFADWFEYEEIKLSDEELDRVLTIYL